jgi:hypothetical protein
MRSTISGVVALGAAALIAAGCGGSGGGQKTAKTTSGKPVAAKSTGAMSTSQYLDAIQRVRKPLDAANSAYFHSSGGSAKQWDLVRKLPAAYIKTVDQLTALHPPAAAVGKQAAVVSVLRTAAGKLRRAIARHDARLAYSIAIATSEKAGQLYDDLFTIPG